MAAGLNLLWLVFGGIVMGIGWLIAGCLLAISIVGIPWARAAFVMANFAFWPFGREAVRRDDYKQAKDIGTGALGLLGNIVWFIFAGFWLALSHAFHAIGCAITIIGIPFAIQHLKLAGHSLAPIGTVIVTKEVAKLVRQQKAEATLARARARAAAPAPLAPTPPPPPMPSVPAPAAEVPPVPARQRLPGPERAPMPQSMPDAPSDLVAAVAAELARGEPAAAPTLVVTPRAAREPLPERPVIVAAARRPERASPRANPLWALAGAAAATVLLAGGYVAFVPAQRGAETAAAGRQLAAAQRALESARDELRRARDQLARSEAERRRLERTARGAAPASGPRTPAAAETAPHVAAGAIRDCDRSAAHPHDPDKAPGIDGVEFKDMDKTRAEESCRQAIAATHGTVARLVYQYARALHAQRRFPEALDAYRKAADLGYAAAEANVGYMHLAGQGVPPDTALALPFLQRAANKGHPEAQFSLMHVLGTDRSSEAERATAYFWGLLAARVYRMQSQEKLSALARGLPEERRADIERQARNWRPGDAVP